MAPFIKPETLKSLFFSLYCLKIIGMCVYTCACVYIVYVRMMYAHACAGILSCSYVEAKKRALDLL